jgi:RimJ/RimL family protein N-acetyltransferase
VPSLVAPTIPAGSLCAQREPILAAGPGLIMRPWVMTDAPAVRAAYQDPEIQRWHVRRADSLAEAESWIDVWRGEWPAEIGASWAVVDATTDELLGRGALKAMNLADATAHVAYWTAPAARGRGVAPAAVEAMTAWAFGAGFVRLSLEHSMDNLASCRVAGKTGYAVESIQRSAWLQADGRHDAHVHVRIRPN